ncbi:hypothetical protein [Streptomyces sp. NPDC056144]|uniref:hypothetical protein n=1 Tax=unclassified Streptomyces TaxID=2593676 RepID=UPI0035E03A61
MTAMPLAHAPAPIRPQDPYENWRPPIVGVGVLAPVGTDHLVLVRTCGIWSIPTGAVESAQDVEDAARSVLTGLSEGLPIHRHVAVQNVQMRRRQVITHTVVTRPLLPEEVTHLVYRDPRAEIRTLSTAAAAAALTDQGRARLGLGLLALAIGATAYIHDDRIQFDCISPAKALPRPADERTAGA